MAYPELERRVAFAAKLEATAGTDAVPTMAADAIRLLEPPEIEEFYLAENLTDDVVTGVLGVLLLAAPGGRAIRFRGRAPLIGAGDVYAAGVLPESDALLVAGGFTRTLDVATPGSETVAYDPSDDPSAAANTTVTVLAQKDGKAYKCVYGVLEELTISCDAAGFPVIAFSIVGMAVAPSEAAVDAAAYDSVLFPIWKGANSFMIGASAAGLHPRSMELNLGLQVAPRLDANATDGHSGYRITHRVPELRVRQESVALATFNPWADWNARTQRAIDFAFGATQYARIKIDMDDVRVIGNTQPAENKLSYTETRFRVARPAAGSECQILFD